MTERTYRCDLCRDEHDEHTRLHCIEWKWDEDPEMGPRSRRDRVKLKFPDEVLHLSGRHLCGNCIRDVAEMCAELRLRKKKSD